MRQNTQWVPLKAGIRGYPKKKTYLALAHAGKFPIPLALLGKLPLRAVLPCQPTAFFWVLPFPSYPRPGRLPVVGSRIRKGAASPAIPLVGHQSDSPASLWSRHTSKSTGACAVKGA